MGRWEDIEVTRHPGGFADVDFKECVGHAGQRPRQHLLPGHAPAAVRRAEQHHGDAGRGGDVGVKFALGQA